MRLVRFLDKMIAKSAFPKVQLFNQELMKLGILRIILGLVIFVRYAEILHSTIILNEAPENISIAVFLLVVVVLKIFHNK